MQYVDSSSKWQVFLEEVAWVKVTPATPCLLPLSLQAVASREQFAYHNFR